MQKVWKIGLMALTRTARDRKALITLLLFPTLMIGVLGAALQNMMGDAHIDPFPVIMINEDVAARPPVPAGTPAEVVRNLPTFDFGRILANDVLGSTEAQKWVKVESGTDPAAARQAVADGEYLGLIQVPATFSADVLAGKQATILLVTDPGRAESAAILEQIVSRFTEAVTSGMLASKYMSPDEARTHALGQTQGDALFQGIPQVIEASAGAKKVSALQYYAASMSIMFMLMTAIGRSADILDEKRQGTLARMLVSPTGRTTIVAGQVLSVVVVVLAQFAILLLGTRFIYGVDWGNWGPTLLIGGSFGLAASGIGIAMAGLLNDARAAEASVGIVGNIFAALSGGMFPLYFFGDGMKMVARFIPNYWALQGFLDHMAGTGASLFTPIAVLVSIGLLTGGVGAWRMAAR